MRRPGLPQRHTAFARATLDSPLVATTNDLKNGLVLNLDGQLWTVVEFQHVKPGKGGAFVRTTLKNVLSGKVVDKTFNAGTKVETATVDKRAMTYLYKEGTDFVFMDGETYDQVHVPADDGRRERELPARQRRGRGRGARRHAALHRAAHQRRAGISHTDPGVQGDRSTGGTKPATLETGAEIQVPLFVTTGEKVKVDTRDGRYLGRVSCYRMAARSKARKRRWTCCTRPTSRGLDPLGHARRRVALAEPPVQRLHRRAGHGVHRAPGRIDEILAEYAEGWTVARMPDVDRAVLRLGVYELLWRDDVPDAVAIDEAVELAKSLSTDDSPTLRQRRPGAGAARPRGAADAAAVGLVHRFSRATRPRSPAAMQVPSYAQLTVSNCPVPNCAQFRPAS